MATSRTAEQRAADWNARGIPRVLWPDVGQKAIERAHRALWAVTAERLAGGIPTIDSAQKDERPLSIAATISGMGPLLGYWHERGEIVCSTSIAQLFAAHLDHGRRRAFNLETGLAAILSACEERSVRPIVMKGTFTARRYFPEPGTRPLADIDMLVRPVDLDATREALRSSGLHQKTKPTFGAETWEPVGSPTVRSVEIDHAENPWTVDLHTSIDRPYFRGRWSTFRSMVFSVTEPWTVRQRVALVFGQPLLLAHLAYHTSRDINRFRLLRIVELILVMRQDRRLDWNACLELLDNGGVKHLVYPAFAFCERLAAGSVPSSFMDTLANAASRRLRRATERLHERPLRAYFTRSPAERLMWADGCLETALCWSDILWPTGSSMSNRIRTFRRRLHMLTGRRQSI